MLMFINEIYQTTERYGSLSIVSDMDGVIAEYKFGEGSNIQNNVVGVFENKRPINTIIRLLDNVSRINGVELFIASSYFFEEQREEKYRWIKKHLPFVKTSNLILVKRDFVLDNERKKLNSINNEVIKNSKITFLIDDTHSLLFKAIEQFGDKVKAFHISSLIE